MTALNLLLILSSCSVAWCINCPTTVLTESDRSVILDGHNSRRSNIAKGLEPKKGGGFAPAASQMYKMVYDCAIEASAQAYADQCQVLVHSNKAGFGENLHWSSQGAPAGARLQDAVTSWWKELIDNEITDAQNRYTSAVHSAGVGHFTQMAWWKTTKIGCGIAYCDYTYSGTTYKGTSNVVCQYQVQGNMRDAVIYPLGSPCTADSQCTDISGSKCDVGSGLCLDPVAQAAGSPSSGTTTKAPTTTTKSGTTTTATTTKAPTTKACLAQWAAWSAWGCSDTCGACGTSVRTRKCATEPSCPCIGSKTEDNRVPCNTNLCGFPRPTCCPKFKRAIVGGKFGCIPV